MDKYNLEDTPENFVRASQDRVARDLPTRASRRSADHRSGPSVLRGAFFSEKRYDLSRVGRYKLDRSSATKSPRTSNSSATCWSVRTSPCTSSKAEVLATATYLLNLARDRTAKETTYHIDDQDHFANRRIRSVGELIQNALRTGLSRMERVVRERMNPGRRSDRAPDAHQHPSRDVGDQGVLRDLPAQPVHGPEQPVVRSDAQASSLALGPGGLSRERAGLEVRDVHSSHYGRMCPIETPEGPNVGLIGYLANYARINEYGFIETPYRVVTAGKVTGRSSTSPPTRRALRHRQANTEVDDKGVIRASACSCVVAPSAPDFASVRQQVVVHDV